MSTTEEPKEEFVTPRHYADPIDQTTTLGPTSALVFNNQLVIMIALAAFFTTFGQTQVIGFIPIKFLIVKKMHMDAQALSYFSLASAFAWNLKPIAGLIIDGIPMFGTRRRSYMLVASGVSILWWIVVGYSSATYKGLLWAAVGLNTFMVFASTAMGALLVEYGQKKAATGGLSAIREGIQNVGSVLVGFAGGYLATKSFHLTGYVGASMMAILFIAAYFMLKERPTAKLDSQVWQRAGGQLRILVSSKQLLSAALMMALIFLAPGFGSILGVYQIDTLHFTPQQLGTLQSLQGATAIAGAFAYGILCRFFNLRFLLVGGIISNVISTLIYFLYHSYAAALIIDPLNAFMTVLAVVPVYDLAARATPKGGEGLGFSLMMAVRNFALFGSDYLGATAAKVLHITFNSMLLLNAGFTACVLILVPFIPAALVARRDGSFAAPSDVKLSNDPRVSTE